MSQRSPPQSGWVACTESPSPVLGEPHSWLTGWDSSVGVAAFQRSRKTEAKQSCYVKPMAWWVKCEIVNHEMEISAWLPAHPLPPEGGTHPNPTAKIPGAQSSLHIIIENKARALRKISSSFSLIQAWLNWYNQFICSGFENRHLSLMCIKSNSQYPQPE